MMIKRLFWLLGISKMNKISEDHPPNVEGKFYVDQALCLSHGVCIDSARENFKWREDTGQVYIYKQPENFDEEENCYEALMCCPMEAIKDDGN